MAKKSNAKRSKSGTKTPNREPASTGPSRPTSPDQHEKVNVDEDEEVVEDRVEEKVDEGKSGREESKAVMNVAGLETVQPDEVEVVQEDEETRSVTEPTKVNGTDKQTDRPSLDDAEMGIDTTAMEGTDEVVPDQEADAIIPPATREMMSDDKDEDEGSNEVQAESIEPKVEVEEIVPTDETVEDIPVQAEDADDHHSAEGDDQDEGQAEEEDDEDRIQSLEAELAQTVREKEHLSTQYRTLLGKLQTMRNSLGTKLKEDAVSPSSPGWNLTIARCCRD